MKNRNNLSYPLVTRKKALRYQFSFMNTYFVTLATVLCSITANNQLTNKDSLPLSSITSISKLSFSTVIDETQKVVMPFSQGSKVYLEIFSFDYSKIELGNGAGGIIKDSAGPPIEILDQDIIDLSLGSTNWLMATTADSKLFAYSLNYTSIRLITKITSEVKLASVYGLNQVICNTINSECYITTTTIQDSKYYVFKIDPSIFSSIPDQDSIKLNKWLFGTTQYNLLAVKEEKNLIYVRVGTRLRVYLSTLDNTIDAINHPGIDESSVEFTDIAPIEHTDFYIGIKTSSVYKMIDDSPSISESFNEGTMDFTQILQLKESNYILLFDNNLNKFVYLDQRVMDAARIKTTSIAPFIPALSIQVMSSKYILSLEDNHTSLKVSGFNMNALIPNCVNFADEERSAQCLDCSHPSHFLHNKYCRIQCMADLSYYDENTETCQTCTGCGASANFQTCDLTNGSNCFECESGSNCQECSGKDQITSECIRCQPGFYLYKGTCVTPADGCPKNTFQYDQGGYSFCKNCYHKCTSCSGVGENQCSSCAFLFRLHNSQSCLNPCPKEYYGKDNVNPPVCESCVADCEVCPYNVCSKCKSNTYLKEGLCLADCGEGYYPEISPIQGAICSICHISCLECTAYGRDKCTSCKPLETNNLLHSNKCLEQCPDNTYMSQVPTTSCLPCDPNCSSCSSGSSADCTKCIPDQYLYNSTCLNACPNKHYIKSGQCFPCEEGCLFCDEDGCLECDEDKSLQEGKCGCLSDQYFEEFNKKCRKNRETVGIEFKAFLRQRQSVVIKFKDPINLVNKTTLTFNLNGDDIKLKDSQIYVLNNYSIFLDLSSSGIKSSLEQQKFYIGSTEPFDQLFNVEDTNEFVSFPIQVDFIWYYDKTTDTLTQIAGGIAIFGIFVSLCTIFGSPISLVNQMRFVQGFRFLGLINVRTPLSLLGVLQAFRNNIFNLIPISKWVLAIDEDWYQCNFHIKLLDQSTSCLGVKSLTVHTLIMILFVVLKGGSSGFLILRKKLKQKGRKNENEQKSKINKNAKNQQSRHPAGKKFFNSIQSNIY